MKTILAIIVLLLVLSGCICKEPSHPTEIELMYYKLGREAGIEAVMEADINWAMTKQFPTIKGLRKIADEKSGVNGGTE